jgi:hypothetical protein
MTYIQKYGQTLVNQKYKGHEHRGTKLPVL